MTTTTTSTATTAPAAALELDAWAAFTRAHGVVRDRIERALLDGHGLALVTFAALAAIDTAPGQRLPMTEVARAVGITKPGTTRLVDRMLRDGLIERRRNGLFVYACPTADGRAALAAARPTFARELRATLGDRLDAVHLAAFGDICARLAAPELPTSTPEHAR